MIVSPSGHLSRCDTTEPLAGMDLPPSWAFISRRLLQEKGPEELALCADTNATSLSYAFCCRRFRIAIFYANIIRQDQLTESPDSIGYMIVSTKIFGKKSIKFRSSRKPLPSETIA